MTEPNNTPENIADAAYEADVTDIDAATAATEEFNYTIGDAVAVEDETAGAEETVEVASFHEGPIQTVGRRKRAIARVTVVEARARSRSTAASSRTTSRTSCTSRTFCPR